MVLDMSWGGTAVLLQTRSSYGTLCLCYLGECDIIG